MFRGRKGAISRKCHTTKQTPNVEKEKRFNVWNAGRTIRKRFSAGNMESLLANGRREFELTLGVEFLRVVQEEDGTIVNNDKYLDLLKPGEVLMLLADGQEWTPRIPMHVTGCRMLPAVISQELLKGASSKLLDACFVRPSKIRVERLFQLYMDPTYKKLVASLNLLPIEKLEYLAHAKPEDLNPDFPRYVVEELQKCAAETIDHHNRAAQTRQIRQDGKDFLRELKETARQSQTVSAGTDVRNELIK